ncbi:hypothetical protein B9Z55_000757 [Caenorhabditis nigoni]|uniref:F-box domain-containing protein n=1 Tax=Caenorhabditis nigoni TaxID=1611254 RepID=A0A2G5VUN2_9PELO|nr:hypothetical protein B9Z55_000757 [Caenorhabditis nigoni]
MILSKYPNLVLKEIFDHLELSELFVLSLGSKNMKNLIKWSQKERFKTIRSIEYLCNNISQPPLVYIPSKRGMESIMDFWNPKKDKYGIFQVNVSGKMIDFQLCNNKKKAMARFEDSDKESVIESIHDYILDFFGRSVQYFWSIDYFKHYSIPKLQNVTFCLEMCLDEDFRGWKKLETFLSSTSFFKCIKLETAVTTEPFHPESKVYQAESLLIIQLRDIVPSPAILRHFKGRQLTITCDRWENSEDLIEFVNKWKSGEAYPKLEYLKFELKNGEIPEDQILNEIGAKYIDAFKKPPTHTVPKVYDWHLQHTEPNTDPITSRAYVVRQSDNRVASILIEDFKFSFGGWSKSIYFGVWNKTEEEFLKMMD